MRKGIKILLISGIVCCVAGAGVMTAGAMMGGIDGLSELPYPYIRENGSFFINRYADESSIIYMAEAEDLGTSELEYSSIRELEIDCVSSGHIQLIHVEPEELPGDVIRVVRNSAGDQEVKYKLRQDGNTLKIEIPGDWREYMNKGGVENLDIYVPISYAFDEVDIKCISGEFIADTLTAAELSIENVSGAVIIEDGQVSELDVNCISGTVECYAVVDQEGDVSCTSGDVTMTMGRSWENYDYKWQALSGTIIIDGEDVKNGNNLVGEQKIDHHTGRSVDLECISGTITINYADESL